MSTTTANLGLFKYDTNSPTDLASAFNINTALNNNWDIIDNAISNSGGARNIGEIVTSTVPLTDAGLHLLDGALIQGSGIYSDFVNYIAGLYDDTDTPNYFTDENTWQQSLTDYGVCGKFVYDSANNTVRLPKYGNQIITKTSAISTASTVPVVGNGITLGLTDGTNNFGFQTMGGAYGGHSMVVSGAYGTNIGSASSFGYVGANKTFGITSDGTKSGLIADISSIKNYPLDCYYYIVIATSTKTAIQVDIDEIATDLNGKADVDLSNCTKPHIVETYVNGTSWYRVYSDGWCEQGGMSSGGEVTITLLKPYRDTMYLIMDALYSTGSGLNVQGTQSIQNYSKTTNGFHLGQGISSTNVSGHYWYTEGYIR